MLVFLKQKNNESYETFNVILLAYNYLL